jgi:hypothetical protein
LPHTKSPSGTESETRIFSPPPDQLTAAERAGVLRRASGLLATRRVLAVGAWTLARLPNPWVDDRPHYWLRPSIVRGVRERLVAFDLPVAREEQRR